jgi:sugar transferase (PEP-CTERM/EpsH1 system associated)
LKILFLSWWFPYPPNNGSRIRNFNLVKQLSRRHSLTLLSFYQKEEELAHLDDMRPYCDEVHVVPSHHQSGTLRHLSGLLSTQPRSLSEMYSPAMQALVNKTVASQRPDLVITSEIGVADKTSVYVAELDLPKVLEDLELGVVKEQATRAGGKLARLRHRLTWRKMAHYTTDLLRRFDGCTVASQHERDHLRELVANEYPIAVVPNGVDLEAYAGDFGQPQPNTLIFTGALSYHPNFEAMDFFLGKVYPLVMAHCPGAALRITGQVDGAVAARLATAGGVTFTGYLPDIRPYVAQSWACVAPLLAGGGTRVKILEAMALGTPVVATSKGAEGLDAVPGRDLLVADAPAEFADHVLRLLNDPALRRQLSENGRRLVLTRYSWATIGQDVGSFLEKIVNGNGRSKTTH